MGYSYDNLFSFNYTGHFGAYEVDNKMKKTTEGMIGPGEVKYDGLGFIIEEEVVKRCGNCKFGLLPFKAVPCCRCIRNVENSEDYWEKKKT